MLDTRCLGLGLETWCLVNITDNNTTITLYIVNCYNVRLQLIRYPHGSGGQLTLRHRLSGTVSKPLKSK